MFISRQRKVAVTSFVVILIQTFNLVPVGQSVTRSCSLGNNDVGSKSSSTYMPGQLPYHDAISFHLGCLMWRDDPLIAWGSIGGSEGK
jgi:hypothetical protein